jgi:hypothetical protein
VYIFPPDVFMALLFESVEDYIEDNNPARVIEVSINSLDLAASGFPRP